MRLYFLRHGIAAERDAWQGDDFDRPLTDEGRKRMAREAKTIAQLGLDLDAIITSPLVRAVQTAEIVAEALRMPKAPVADERLGPDFDTRQLAAIQADHPEDGAIMLVGHEPTMSETIGRLIGAARVDLKKGALACVELPDGSSSAGELLWLAPPKLLTR